LYKENQLDYEDVLCQVAQWKFDLIHDKILCCSKEFYQISGIEYGQFDGQLINFLDIMHPDDKFKIEIADRKIDLKKDFDFEFEKERA